MSEQTSANEAAFWSGVDLEDVHGVPPYDVVLVAYRIHDLHPAATRCLDLGCGDGRLTNLLAEMLPDATVFGVDISQPLIHRAVTVAPSNALYWRGDGRHISNGPPDRFDLVWSVTMFQHIPWDAQVEYIRQVHDRLRPGGVFTFTVALGDGVSTPFNFTYAVSDLDHFVGWLSGLFDSVEVEHDVGDHKWTWVTCR